MIEKFQLIFIITILFACNRANKPSISADSEVQATVKDMRSLDGCSYFLITNEGKKLLPYNTETIQFALKDGQKVMVSYNKKQNVDGICMAEDLIIEIKSIRLVEEAVKPEKKECLDMIDPVKTEWGRNAMLKDKVYRMWKYNYQDGYAYYLLGPQRNILYDCQGNKMCEDVPNAYNCTNNIAELSNGKIVWTLNQ